MSYDQFINDPGHGGTDPGAVSHGNTEKVYTLEAAMYVNQRLATHGFKTSTTRTTDVTLDSGPRTAKVKASGATRCFSHHFNASGGSGVEVITSIYSDQRMAKMIIEEFKNAGYPVRPHPVLTRKGSNGKDYYFMHRETGSVETEIIEYDFVDGPQAEKIKDKNYRVGMYEAVVRAVCRFEGVKYYPPQSEAAPSQPANNEIVKIQTGGLTSSMLKDVADYFISNGWWAQVIFPGNGSPYAITGGLGTGAKQEFEKWLKDHGWYYTIEK